MKALLISSYLEGSSGKYENVYVTLPLNPLPREEDLPSLRSNYFLLLVRSSLRLKWRPTICWQPL